MSEDGTSGIPDRLVELVARAMDALGLNGTRLRWRWNQRRQVLTERRARASVMLRSARGRHKMCRSCRALVPRSARQCPECGASLSGVSTPGFGRLLTQLLPGLTATTSLIMLVNGFWFVMMLMAQVKTGEAGGGLLGGFGGELLVRFGSGLSRYYAPLQTGGEWWRIVTPIFLHGGLLHFFFNSYLLLNLGPVVEQVYGTRRFWVVYLACGIAGSAVSQLLRPVNTVGASGAIMGLIGLLLVYGIRRRSVLGQSIKGLLIRLVLYSVILSFFFNIDHLNHAGGLACGALMGLTVPDGAHRSPATARAWEVVSFAGVLLVLLAFYQVARQARLS